MTEKLSSLQSRIFSHRKIVGLGALTLTGATLAACTLTGHHPAPTSKPTTGNINLLKGQWGFMPGASQSGKGLHIAPRGFKIVEQDGSGGQENPPVNTYGTHLKIKKGGDFTVRATLQHIKGAAALDFYATPPKVSDEFRVETPRVRASITKDKLHVQEWDGYHNGEDLAAQTPAHEHAYQIESGAIVDFAMTDENGEITFSVGGEEIGHIPDAGTFDDGTIYFGAESEGSGNAGFDISDFSAEGLHGDAIQAIDVSKEAAFAKDPNALQMLASKMRPGFLIGSDVALWPINDNSYQEMVLKGNFGSLTPENAGKWQSTEPEPGVFDFQEIAALVDLAQKNNMKIWGHNLVFSEALPDWVRKLHTDTPEEKAHVKRVMVDHITQLVSQFKGKVIGWDVVNEPFKDYDNFDPAQPLRANVFYRAMGADYIRIALEAARKADPSAKLYINENSNETDTEDRWNATYNVVKRLKEQGVPLDGVGFQAHIYNPAEDDIAEVTDDYNGRTTLENHINAFGKLGVDSRISEMDAPQHSTGYDGSSQAKQFAGVLQVCLDNPHCKTFSIWSTGETDIYQNDARRLKMSIDSPFDLRNKPTATYAALQNVLR